MQRTVICSACRHRFAQELPDVPHAVSARIEAANGHRREVLLCPNCELWNSELTRFLPNLPEPP
jgi:hypothetical protein